ncbi:MAG: molybdopterin molybdotransferase MoeA [Desulfobacterales bacterium]|nr:molybdopterin molybdotransferase MoeA [Desulfobacterales bacterium]MDD4072880.1 molybdopterin molybdotransferase MoeA [Desulfobacterales bacterium]MDD4392325.1 molybdopterin molybdotransferase MoeA [Desulfobacterales bacterium]
MNEFFKVTPIEHVLNYTSDFAPVEAEIISLPDALERILAEDIVSDINIPDFARSTMDGYAVSAKSTFGASESNPAYFMVKGAVFMGETPDFSIGPEQAARIPTGGMLPKGADSVVMIEHTEAVDDSTIEVYRAVAPGQHIVDIGEDILQGNTILPKGVKIRPQELGLLAALGRTRLSVYRQPVVGIISTGDELIPIDQIPAAGKIRDINTYTLAGLVREAGGIPLIFGIMRDNFDQLHETCSLAASQSDMMLISGGSSVGTRDFTIDAISSLPESEILVHGISISPGKPTILARVGNKMFWGLPGHVVSAMVVFSVVVRPFFDRISGITLPRGMKRITARLTRNLPSAQGRTDFIRVRFIEKSGEIWAEPVIGKSGLINTMVKADGLVEIPVNTEGFDQDTPVNVIPL